MMNVYGNALVAIQEALGCSTREAKVIAAEFLADVLDVTDHRHPAAVWFDIWHAQRLERERQAAEA